MPFAFIVPSAMHREISSGFISGKTDLSKTGWKNLSTLIITMARPSTANQRDREKGIDTSRAVFTDTA